MAYTRVYALVLSCILIVYSSLDGMHAQDIKCVVCDIADVLVQQSSYYDTQAQTYTHVYQLNPEGRDLIGAMRAYAYTSQRMLHFCIATNYRPQVISAMRNTHDIANLIDLNFDRLYALPKRRMRKPSQKAYAFIARMYHISPEQCAVIDAVYNHVQQAQAYGMHGVHFDQKNLKKTYDHLRTLDLLPSTNE